MVEEVVEVHLIHVGVDPPTGLVDFILAEGDSSNFYF